MSIKGEITQALCRRIDGVGPKRAAEIVDVLVAQAHLPDWASRYAASQMTPEQEALGIDHPDYKAVHNEHMLNYWYVLDFIKEWA